MGNFWCVDPVNNVEEIPLSYGGRDFKIFLKRELTVGEQRSIDTSGFRSVAGLTGKQDAEPEIMVDFKRQSFAKTVAYLVDWTLSDDLGNKMPLGEDSVRSLRPAVYKVIEDAVKAHVERTDAIRGNAETGASSPQQMLA